MISRRQLLAQAAAVAALSPFSNVARALATQTKLPFKIGACDWSIGKDSDVGAFGLARQIGLAGIQVNIGSAGNNLHLRDKDLQLQFLDASQSTGVSISSIAIGELNNVPYKSDPRTEEWVWDSIDIAKNLKAPVVLLAFFHKNDLRNDAAGMAEVIRRLRQVAPKAEKAGVILGIESYLNAAEHMRILDGVGSKNVQVYYDFRNTADAGFDPVKEFKLLHRHICELHMKENGVLLGKGTLDWKTISNAIKDTNYFGSGWMQIEWAMPKEADVVASYQHNLNFLRNHF